MDMATALRDTGSVVEPGLLRQRIAGVLNAAFVEGLLSERTYSYRLGQLFALGVVDPQSLVGDLAFRAPRRHRPWTTLVSWGSALRWRVAQLACGIPPDDPPLLLALDWTGSQDRLTVGRDVRCDVVVTDPTVSRQHARLLFRDCGWVIQDLHSTNGTAVNGIRVGRSQLYPGDHLLLGRRAVDVD
jgi:hypothetical protein